MTCQQELLSGNWDRRAYVGLIEEGVVQVLALPGIGGLHVMPLTKAARKQTLELQADGVLPTAKGQESI